jgi:hypothetical protein
MTTPDHGGTSPLTSSSASSTPIGDELAYDAGLGAEVGAANSSTGDSDTSMKEAAQDAMGSASDHASDVAGTAKDEAAKVASEAKDKASDLLADVRSQLDEQSRTQLQNLSSKLDELAGQIESMAAGSEAPGPVTDLAQQLADRTHQLSSHLESRQPMDLVEDVRSFARRRPAAFLAGAAVAGMVAGRLTRGVKASAGSEGGSSSGTTATGSVTAPVAPAGGAVGDVELAPAGQNTGGRQ